MRLLTFIASHGPSRLGYASDERVLDVTAAMRALAETSPTRYAAHWQLLEGAPHTHAWLTPEGLNAIREVVSATAGDSVHWHARAALKVGVPVPRPGKIIATGRNYLNHVKEGQQIWAARGRKVEIPTFPTAFAKFPSSLRAHDDTLDIPRGIEAVDYEVELAVVIGKFAHNVGEAHALEHVAGYTVCNDVGARRIQMAEMEAQIGLVLSKNLPTFAPLGPWLVTADEIPDPQQLTLSLTVNGQERQHASTADMIFSVAKLVSYWSQIGLEPGDIISTGTPSGVAIGRAEPDKFFLKDGDEVCAQIERIGTLRNRVRAL